ncbi:hypothetical protein BaRGS_00008702 [Batillaria attramentaria]|uniref:Uncharacterized protein n=1 Tax=Batillaria attramentaria TaxID=370345 RepID=A0ABD0LL19_9CAEN
MTEKTEARISTNGSTVHLLSLEVLYCSDVLKKVDVVDLPGGLCRRTIGQNSCHTSDMEDWDQTEIFCEIFVCYNRRQLAHPPSLSTSNYTYWRNASLESYIVMVLSALFLLGYSSCCCC